MKKILPLFTFFLFTFPFAAQAAPFPDVKSPILLEAVNYLNEEGIIKGYPDGTFKPDQVINRAEALKIIFETVGIEAVIQSGASESEPDSPFPDVPSTQWFATYVSEAKNRGLISGYPDGTYKPTQFVNKAEFMKIAMLAQNYYQEPASSDPVLSQFEDLDPSAWYIPYLGFALNNEFVDRVSKFNPTGGMSRGEAALIIYRVAQHNESLVAEPEPLPYLSCETCVNGVDLSQYEWSTLPFVKIQDGKLFIDGYDESDQISVQLGDENVQSNIQRAKLKYLPLEEKLKVDQIYPELYKRAIELRGGIQDKDKYLDWPPLNKRIVTKEGKIINECDECGFEVALTNNYQNQGYPPFEDWIGTKEAKPFIYDTIQTWLEDHPDDAH